MRRAALRSLNGRHVPPSSQIASAHAPPRPFARALRERLYAFVAEGDAARDRGVWNEAACRYADALAFRRDAGICVQYGHALKESGDIEGAIAAYRFALAQAPLADTHLNLGHALKLEGERAAAVAAYLDALRIDPGLHDASAELVRLGVTLREIAFATGRARARPVTSGPGQVFDISDLLAFLDQAARPLTGIQRVQVGLGLALLADPATAATLRFAGYDPTREAWMDLPPALFRSLAGSPASPRQADTLRAAVLERAGGDPVAWQPGDWLLDLGGAASRPNHLLCVRHLKVSHGVRYAPFVHDLVPLLFPRSTAAGVPAQFADWLSGALDAADIVLTNSQATATGLRGIVRAFGIAEPPVRVVPLAPGVRPDDMTVSPSPHPRPYALLVGTLEPRKNHLLALQAWRGLLAAAAGPIPDLLLVGLPGWRHEAVLAAMDDPVLAPHVRLITNACDAMLGALYRHCLFTVVPSLYEGWGLTVSESLAFGKPCLVARVGALEEAGGAFADYFDPTDPADFAAALGRMVHDAEYREARAKAIRAGHVSRNWTEMATDIAALREAPARPVAPSWIVPAGYRISFATNPAEALEGFLRTGEDLRAGTAWDPPGKEGTRLRPPTATLRLRLPAPAPAFLALELEAPADGGWRVAAAQATVDLAPGARGWLLLPVAELPRTEGVAMLEINCTPMNATAAARPLLLALVLTDKPPQTDEDASGRELAFQPEVPAVQRCNLLPGKINFARRGARLATR